jgi:hypothetical protein
MLFTITGCKIIKYFYDLAKYVYRFLRDIAWAFMHKISDRVTVVCENRLLQVRSGKMSVTIQLNNTRTARSLYSLASRELGDQPIMETGKLDGKELYFLIPLRAWRRFVPDWRRWREVRLGDVAYWPRGGYLCIFFGPRPHNPPGRIVPCAPVVVVGRVIEGLDQIRYYNEFSTVLLESVAENG